MQRAYMISYQHEEKHETFFILNLPWERSYGTTYSLLSSYIHFIWIEISSLHGLFTSKPQLHSCTVFGNYSDHLVFLMIRQLKST